MRRLSALYGGFDIATTQGTAVPRSRTTAAVLWTLLAVGALVGLGWGAASLPLIDPDEGRNAEVAREMAAGGDWVVPHLNGVPYLDKPVLFFAATALSIETLGATELAVRLPPFFFTLAAVALTMALGGRIFGRETALLGGLVLATCPLLYIFSRTVIFDSAMLFWVTAALIAFYRAAEGDGWAWPTTAWGAVGCAVLTKGPVGLALPVLIVLVYAVVCGLPLRRLFHPLGLAVCAAIVLPWFLAVLARHPEFAHYALVRESWQRFATDHSDRTGPIWYFLPPLIGGSLPWVLAPLLTPAPLAAAWRKRQSSGRHLVYLLLWIGVPLLFFSLSQSKRIGYILPVLPALALLCAHLLLARGEDWRRVVYACSALAAAGVVVLFLGARAQVAELVAGGAVAAEIQRAAPWLAAMVLAAAGVAALAARCAIRWVALTAMAALPVVAVTATFGPFAAVADDRSARSLAGAIQDAAPSARLVAIEDFPFSLAFYTRSQLLLAVEPGKERGGNYAAEYSTELRQRPDSPLRPAEWWRVALHRCSEPTVFVAKGRRVAQRAELAAALPLIADNGRYAAYGPCRPVPELG